MSLDLNCLKISSDINPCGAQLQIGDYKECGVLLPYSEVLKSSIVYDGCKVNFSLRAGGIGLKVYDRSFEPFKGTNVTEENKERFKEYTDLVVFPMLERSSDNAYQLHLLTQTTERWVFITEQEKVNATGDNRFQIFGINGGLTLKTAVADIANQSAFAITLNQVNSGYPSLFLFDTNNAATISKVDSFVGYDTISGIALEVGGALITNSLKKYYIILGDGNIIEPVINGSSEYKNTYINTSSKLKQITIHCKSDAPWFSISNSNVVGALNTNVPNLFAESTGLSYITCDKVSYLNANSCASLLQVNSESARTISVNNCVLLNYVNAESLTSLYATNCALSATSIAFILRNAVLTGETSGYVDISGGNNAAKTEWSAQAVADYDTLVSRSWTITFNAIP